MKTKIRHVTVDDTENIDEILILDWNAWVAELPIEHQIQILLNNIQPWNKFALKVDPDASYFFRISEMSTCEDEHLHISLNAYTSSGVKFGELVGVDLENLLPYKYSEISPPSKKMLEEEREFVHFATLTTTDPMKVAVEMLAVEIEKRLGGIAERADGESIAMGPIVPDSSFPAYDPILCPHDFDTSDEGGSGH